MSALRILVAHNVPARRTGGMSRIMGFIHDRLADHGHHVDYFTADDMPEKWQSSAGRRFGFPLLVRHAAVAAARSGRPYDIVNVHEPHSLPITIGRASTGFPSVFVTSHGLERRAWTLAKEEARLGRATIGGRTRLTYPLTSLWPAGMGLQRADHIFCLNFDDRDYLMRHLGRTSDSVTRIFPGADHLYANHARKYERASRILFAASWRDNKGIADLVPAFVILAERHAALTLTVVGAGVPDAIVLAQFPASLHKRIAFETPSTEAGMAAAFAAADIFLLPSLFEGTPLTLIQAMMNGLPIVTTATCGMKDVISDRVTGLLIPIRRPDAIVSAVEDLMADRGLRERLGRAAQSAALANYTWDRVARPIEEAYLRVRGKGAGEAAA
jgi:glycosyltransferase involved in cell wall biosynthesis